MTLHAQAQTRDDDVYGLTAPALRGTTAAGSGIETYSTGRAPATGDTADALLPPSDEETAATSPVAASDEPAASPFPGGEADDLSAMGRIGALQTERDRDPGYGPQNLPQATLDGLTPRADPDRDLPPGFRLGTFLLRPTLTEMIVHEQDSYGSQTSSRTFSETIIQAALQSDWSRHRLTVEGRGAIQQNISGTGEENPSAGIFGALDLDFTETTRGLLRAGYEFRREDRSDPNAVAGASAQAAVHAFSTSAGLSGELGRLRGTVTTEYDRTVYGDARLASGTVIPGDDRNNSGYGLTGRLGYAVSPALNPFLEASIKRNEYDLATDRAGYARSASTYGLRAGVEFASSDKMTGELAFGYARREIEDERLADIKGFTVDGRIDWSPLRGTLLTTSLATAIEDSITPGRSGSIAHRLSVGLEHQLRHTVVARLTGSAFYRDYVGAAAMPAQTVYSLNGELDWSINRYLSLVAEAGVEQTEQSATPDSQVARIGLGLRLRR